MVDIGTVEKKIGDVENCRKDFIDFGEISMRGDVLEEWAALAQHIRDVLDQIHQRLQLALRDQEYFRFGPLFEEVNDIG